jgi:DNA-binding HxlR family transcriptional regulator
MPAFHKTLISQCSIARAAELIGDGWTLLIIRELFWGSTRYEQLAERTGMASNILATRLRKMLDYEIISKTVVADDARRFDYALTKKGQDLFPVLMAVMAWGDRWSSGDSGPLIQLRHAICGKKTRPGVSCSACGELLIPAQLRTKLSSAYASLSKQRL